MEMDAVEQGGGGESAECYVCLEPGGKPTPCGCAMVLHDECKRQLLLRGISTCTVCARSFSADARPASPRSSPREPATSIVALVHWGVCVRDMCMCVCSCYCFFLTIVSFGVVCIILVT